MNLNLLLNLHVMNLNATASTPSDPPNNRNPSNAVNRPSNGSSSLGGSSLCGSSLGSSSLASSSLGSSLGGPPAIPIMTNCNPPYLLHPIFAAHVGVVVFLLLLFDCV
eukprot:99054_1